MNVGGRWVGREGGRAEERGEEKKEKEGGNEKRWMREKKEKTTDADEYSAANQRLASRKCRPQTAFPEINRQVEHRKRCWVSIVTTLEKRALERTGK